MREVDGQDFGYYIVDERNLVAAQNDEEFSSVRSGESVTADRIRWKANKDGPLVKWGRGTHGYSRQTHQDATYFYDWLGEVGDDHPIFQFGTTRIQHILWANRTKPGRHLLLAAIVSGPLQGLSDDEFAWVMGKRTKNWPLDEASRTELVVIGEGIKAGSQLTTAEREKLIQILQVARNRISTGTPGPPVG